MILGIGVDTIEIERVEKAIQKEAFVRKVFSEAERCEKQHPETLAGRFAAKEAVVKALGCGFIGIEPGEVELLHNEAGAPWIRLQGGALAKARTLGAGRIHVSISHDNTRAEAFVVIEKEEQP